MIATAVLVSVSGPNLNFILSKKSLKIPKRVFRNNKAMKDRQHNGQTKKDKRINNDLQNITQINKRSSNTNPTKKSRVNSCTPEG